jgi:hypothetical protein
MQRVLIERLLGDEQRITWARRQRTNVGEPVDREHSAALNSVNAVVRPDCIKVSSGTHDQPGGIEIRIFANYYAGRVHYPDALGDLVGDVQVACGIHGNAQGTQRRVQSWLAICGLVAAWRCPSVRRDTDHQARKLRSIKITPAGRSPHRSSAFG